MHGERELTTGLLSKDASFRLIVSGQIGEKEIDRLIRKLRLDKEILADTEGPRYELRLYKSGSSNKAFNELVQTIPIEASTDAEAIEKAKNAQIPRFDDSSYAILFGAFGHELWRLDAQSKIRTSPDPT